MEPLACEKSDGGLEVVGNLTRTTIKAKALFDCSFGVLLLLASWFTGIYRLLDLPNPQPAVYTQFCGGLLWLAPANPALARPVALSIRLVNLAGALLLAGWIVSGALGIGDWVRQSSA